MAKESFAFDWKEFEEYTYEPCIIDQEFHFGLLEARAYLKVATDHTGKEYCIQLSLPGMSKDKKKKRIVPVYPTYTVDNTPQPTDKWKTRDLMLQSLTSEDSLVTFMGHKAEDRFYWKIAALKDEDLNDYFFFVPEGTKEIKGQILNHPLTELIMTHIFSTDGENRHSYEFGSEPPEQSINKFCGLIDGPSYRWHLIKLLVSLSKTTVEGINIDAVRNDVSSLLSPCSDGLYVSGLFLRNELVYRMLTNIILSNTEFGTFYGLDSNDSTQNDCIDYIKYVYITFIFSLWT
jgi:hypothetical protein